MSKEKRIPMADDENHPKLVRIKEYLNRNPNTTKKTVVNMFSINHECATAWERNGWVKFGKPNTKKHPWRNYPS